MTRQLILNVGLSDRACFENYYAGANAEVLHSIGRLIEGDTGLLFLWGEEGAGKTHLLFAAQKAVLSAGRHASYLSINDEQVLDGLSRFGGADALICVDDVDHAAGDRRVEQLLFNLLEILRPERGALLVAGRKPPSECEFRMADLSSRLNSGASFRLSPLTDGEKAAAMRLRAEQRGFHLPEDVIAYVMRRYPRNTSALFALLDRIDHYSLSEQRMVTVPLLKSLEADGG